MLNRVAAVNVGLASFGEAVQAQGAAAVDVEWRPPADGDRDVLRALERLWGPHAKLISAANEDAVGRIESATPRAVAIEPARDVVPGLGERTLIHSGTAIDWGRVCDPQRRALIAACIFEGWARDPEQAAGLLSCGAVALSPGHEHNHVGPMTGVCSPSMPVWVVADEDSGARAYSTLNEGPGRTLWFGVGDQEAIDRLYFFAEELGPALAKIIKREGPIEVFSLAAQGLQMGDELHMRSQATGNLLIRSLLPGFAAIGGERSASFLAGNHHFFLNLTMAAAKCALLPASGVRGSSVVNLISRNGTEMGIQLAGLPGRWFQAPAAPVQDALLRDGYGEEDAALDIGDSSVIECVGLGGMALAASPAVAAFFGGAAADAIARTELMSEITVTRSRRFTIPALDFTGSPVGIDARLAAELAVTPQITTGVLHATSGAGQIGAGVAHQPVTPFRAAVIALAAELEQTPRAAEASADRGDR
ncbi:MAG: DUF1116 domain-containing protein [Solirubrobacterales bacterium]|nr:DUF1116 domain-containing protein [Solirubrobacterales bacterium]